MDMNITCANLSIGFFKVEIADRAIQPIAIDANCPGFCAAFVDVYSDVLDRAFIVDFGDVCFFRQNHLPDRSRMVQKPRPILFKFSSNVVRNRCT